MEEDFFVSTQVDDHRYISISSISKATFEEAAAEFFPNDRGYFICEHDDRLPSSGFSVLAKVASLDAAYRLMEIWQIRPSAANSPSKLG